MSEKKKINIANELYELLDSVILSAVCVLLVFTFIFRVFIVSGPSMFPTLENGDRLIVSNLFYTPEQGDIICFYSDVKSEILVKRVIAVAGQTVDIDSTHNVTIDGVRLQEDYIRSGITYEKTMSLPYTVKEDEVFVMGDNRTDSLDSRYAEIGAVDNNDILGKLVIRLFPNFGKVR